MPSPQQKYPPYMEYLAVRKGVSERTGRSLRMLDRALYQAKGSTQKSAAFAATSLAHWGAAGHGERAKKKTRSSFCAEGSPFF